MNKLITKARSGVTLVELLVVILIVTILSVSMLPLLQPFVVESQYAAEAIPVIGNLRTKIGIYMYDKGLLPYNGVINDIHTWAQGVQVTTGSGQAATTVNDAELFGPVYKQLSTAAGSPQIGTDITKHLGRAIDVDYQDLKGKRSKPSHYQYYPLSVTNGSYVVGCFGDGGLKPGTGYAVCELNYSGANKKYIGTWKRYKPVSDDAGAITFSTDNSAYKTTGKTLNCYVPTSTQFASDLTTAITTTDKPALVKAMELAGWEF